jgi:hypothetical protein
MRYGRQEKWYSFIGFFHKCHQVLIKVTDKNPEALFLMLHDWGRTKDAIKRNKVYLPILCS